VSAASLIFCVLLSGCRNHDFPEYPANYREYAYVTNGASGTVSVFDVVHVRLDREIQVGLNPTAVAPNPKRNEVYVVNSGNGQANGSVSVIDTEKNAVVATIPVRRKPVSVDVDANGERAYVANSASNSVSVLDLTARREVAVLGTGEEPRMARISRDGQTLVVPNRAGNSVSLLDVPDPKMGASVTRAAQTGPRRVIEGCPGASDAVILPDSSKAFAACSGGHQIMAIALARPADGNGAARPDALEALLEVGRSPVHLALKPDGGELFVSNFDSDSISEVITSTDDVGGAYVMGSNPIRGVVSEDNAVLYEANFRSQEITLYMIEDGKRADSIHVGDGPSALGLSARGHLLFAVDANSGDVAVIRTSTRSLFTLLPTGRQPNAIALKAFLVP
jgi:YVTN family beta-propeller protein